MRCEKVVSCDTRGSDGVSVVAVSELQSPSQTSIVISLYLSVQYYDWENNKCHPLNYILDDNVAIQEKDIVIPAELDPAQNAVFPDFEPDQIKKLVSYNLNR